MGYLSKIAYAKRYSSISMEEIREFSPEEFDIYLDELNEIIKRENITSE